MMVLCFVRVDGALSISTPSTRTAAATFNGNNDENAAPCLTKDNKREKHHPIMTPSTTAVTPGQERKRNATWIPIITRAQIAVRDTSGRVRSSCLSTHSNRVLGGHPTRSQQQG